MRGYKIIQNERNNLVGFETDSKFKNTFSKIKVNNSKFN